jgi:hypothetical protein
LGFEISTTANGRNPDIRASEQGESDEMAVYRILWDLADGDNPEEPWDQISLGHNGVFGVLLGVKESGNMDELRDVWNYLYTHTSEFTSEGSLATRRATLGAVFEKNGVAPFPTGFREEKPNPDIPEFPIITHAIHDTANPFYLNSPVPQFEWRKNNNDNAFDNWRIDVLTESDLDVALFAFDNDDLMAVRGQARVGLWQPSESQWEEILSEVRSENPGEAVRFKYLITGFEQADPASAYNSGFHYFTIVNAIPEPSALALAAIGAVAVPACGARRRSAR